jgi:hypothetical protein
MKREILVIDPQFERDPEGRGLETLLRAQSGYEHAHARRIFLGHLTVIGGVLVWLTAVHVLESPWREFMLAVYAVIALGFAVSLASEWRWSRRLQGARRALPRTRVLAVALALLFLPAAAHATPSSTLWTWFSPDIQGYKVLHVGVDNYFTVAHTAEDGSGAFATDAGLTMGVLPSQKFQMELGVDLVEPTDDPLYFNGKAGAPEGVLFTGAPTLQLGVALVGTESNATNYNVGYAVIGKTIPGLGRLGVGPYVGNGAVLRDVNGEKENTGFVASFDRGFAPAQDAAGNTFNRFVACADYASGKNALGGGAVGLYYYFHPNVSLVAGPVWFNEAAINGKTKWTVQLDINQALSGK